MPMVVRLNGLLRSSFKLGNLKRLRSKGYKKRVSRKGLGCKGHGCQIVYLQTGSQFFVL